MTCLIKQNINKNRIIMKKGDGNNMNDYDNDGDIITINAVQKNISLVWPHLHETWNISTFFYFSS